MLSLSTEDGAILDENDPISIVIGKSEIHATVLSWNLPPLVDRYEEVCASSNIGRLPEWFLVPIYRI